MENSKENFSVIWFLLTLFLTISIIIGIFFITDSTLIHFLVIFYISFSLLISNMHYFSPRLSTFNKIVEKLLPINKQHVKAGPTSIFRFIYMVVIGIIIVIIGYTFLPWFGPSITTTSYAFFEFMNESGSLTLYIIFGFIIFCPVIFCALFTGTSMTYHNENKSKYSKVVIFLPVIFYLPYISFIFTKSFQIIYIFAGIESGSLQENVTSLLGILTTFIIFVIAWIVTLKLWYGEGTKRNVLIILSIGFIQCLASLFMFYHYLVEIVAFGSSYSFSGIFHPIYIPWFFVLIFIPLILKAFDKMDNDKFIGIGIILAVTAAFLFQTWSFQFNLDGIPELGIFGQREIQVYLGLGYVYYYMLIFLLPLFFLFGYFQIIFITSIYRTITKYAGKKSAPWRKIIKNLSGIIALFLLMFWIIVYYAIFYQPNDYYAGFLSVILVFPGELFNLFNQMLFAPSWPKDLLLTSEFGFIVIFTTVIFLTYSTFKLFYKLISKSNKIGADSENKFPVFFKGVENYKSRLFFGFSLIFIFIGTISIYSFFWIYYLKNTQGSNIYVDSIVLVFTIIENLKLIVSILGFVVAIVFFFRYMQTSKNSMKFN